MVRPATTEPSPSLQVALAEFDAVSAEIARRSTAQTALITLIFTAVAAIVSVALAQNKPVLLLALPTLSSTLGIFWLDHANTIAAKGRYIETQLRAVICSETGNDRLLRNEAETRDAERDRFLRLTGNLPLFVFAAVSLLAAAVAADLLILHPGGLRGTRVELKIGAYFGLVFGIGLTLFYAYVAYQYVIAPSKAPTAVTAPDGSPESAAIGDRSASQ